MSLGVGVVQRQMSILCNNNKISCVLGQALLTDGEGKKNPEFCESAPDSGTEYLMLKLLGFIFIYTCYLYSHIFA